MNEVFADGLMALPALLIGNGVEEEETLQSSVERRVAGLGWRVELELLFLSFSFVSFNWGQ